MNIDRDKILIEAKDFIDRAGFFMSENVRYRNVICEILTMFAEQQLNNLLKPDVSGSSCDDFTDEEDYIDEPCPTCGDVNGMVNPCCAGYDPLHFRNCGYG